MNLTIWIRMTTAYCTCHSSWWQGHLMIYIKIEKRYSTVDFLMCKHCEFYKCAVFPGGLL